MSQSIVADTNEDISALVDAWCDRRAIGPLRIILSCYPLVNNLTDDWDALASGLKAIRVKHSHHLEQGEMDTVARLQHLAEAIVYR